MEIIDTVYQRNKKLEAKRRKELKTAKDIACKLVEKFGARKVILYGSLAREDTLILPQISILQQKV